MQPSGIPEASAEGPQQERVNDIADDTIRLIQRAREMVIILYSRKNINEWFQFFFSLENNNLFVVLSLSPPASLFLLSVLYPPPSFFSSSSDCANTLRFAVVRGKRHHPRLKLVHRPGLPKGGPIYPCTDRPAGRRMGCRQGE